MSPRPEPPEIVLSAAWHGGAVPATLTTVDGIPLELVHRGAWSHGLGPDFNDALILFGGKELRAGSVEIHLRTRSWVDHGHHLDPAYNAVVLHVVGRHDGTDTRRQDGAIVPVAEIGPSDRFAAPEFSEWDWSRVGGNCCAERLARVDPLTLREILFRLGDIRLAARSARLEALLPSEPPGEILWAELLDGLGYAANRQPMRTLAELVRLSAIEDLLQTAPATGRIDLARGVLLGAAGFLPLSPIEAHIARLSDKDLAALEEAWHDRGEPWRSYALSPTTWQRARVRPANHPVPRLLAAASMVTAASLLSGFHTALLELLHSAAGPVAALRALAASHDGPGIGEDRALDMVASSLIPFALALAAHSGDASLADAASRHWERLPSAAPNAVSRRAAQQVAGSAPLGKIGARGAQGLLHLDTTLCQPRRCFECPIAAAELTVKG
jgi:hypothetical protein